MTAVATKKREVVARHNTTNELRIGDGIIRRGVLVIPNFQLTIEGQVKRFAFIGPNKQQLPNLRIEGQRVFNLNDPIDAHNWKLLQIAKAHPVMGEELAADLVLIDTEKDADEALVREKRIVTLKAKLFEISEDTEMLAKLYRRVFGPASGLAANVMSRMLLEEAQKNPDAFGTVDAAGNVTWIFEESDFAMQALLDQAIERGILVKDGEFINRANGKPYAENRARAVYALANDIEMQAYIAQSTAAPVTDTVVAPTAPTLENNELVKLASEIGQPVPELNLNEDGSVNEQAAAEQKRNELNQLFDQLVSRQFIVKDENADLYSLPDIGLMNFTRDGIIDHFSVNPLNAETYRNMLSK